jgi:hypothetical protein
MISKSKRIALITGASANAGARIVIHCGRSASDGDSLCKQIQGPAAMPTRYLSISRHRMAPLKQAPPSRRLTTESLLSQALAKLCAMNASDYQK